MMNFDEFATLGGNAKDMVMLETNGLLNEVRGLDVNVGGSQANEL